MMPLLTRLENEMSACADPIKHAELRAERACYLARIGRFQEANATAKALRRDYGDGKSATVLIWVMIVEGLVLYFEALDVKARDRMLRAQALSAAFRLENLERTASAWLAHIEFNRGHHTLMVANLGRCIKSTTVLNGAWKTRFCIVLANALLDCCEKDSAQIWYEHARRLAIEQGDQATIGAVIYNRSVLNLVNLRVAAARGKVDQEAVNIVYAEVNSSYNYQLLSQQHALSQLSDMCLARVQLLRGSSREAARLLTKLISGNPKAQKFNSDWPVVYIELSLCLLDVGDLEAAHYYFLKVKLNEYVKLDLDDQMIFLQKYSQAAIRFGVEIDLDKLRARMSDVSNKYETMQMALRSQLNRLLETIAIEWDADRTSDSKRS